MFYESFGILLEQAARVLSRDVRPEVGDERVRTQLDAVAALVADVGALWPALLRGLEEENEILAEALDAHPPAVAAAGPIERRRALIALLNDRIDAAAEGDAARLAELQEAIRASADVQRRIMETATGGRVSVRRI